MDAESLLTPFATINGGDGPDVLTGTDDADILNGLAGDDSLSGLGGADTLDGGAGRDTLRGGDGDDVLQGGRVTVVVSLNGFTLIEDDVTPDTLDGGAGADRLSGGLEDTFLGGDGDDVLSATPRTSGSPGGGSIDAGGGADQIVVGGPMTVRTGPGGDLLSVSYAANFTAFTLTVLDFTVSGPEQDRLSLRSFPGNPEIPLISAQGADATILFLSYTVLLRGVTPGQLTAANFVDFTPPVLTYTVGSSGDDTLTGGAGNDGLIGQTGDDTLRGLGGDDLLQGGAGLDTLEGGDGADRLLGGEGADSLFGGAGDDRIEAGAGDDLIQGGDGADKIIDNEAGATVRIDAGSGDDVVTLSDVAGVKGAVAGGAGRDVIGGNIDFRVLDVSGFEVLSGKATGTADQLAMFSLVGAGETTLTLTNPGRLDLTGRVDSNATSVGAVTLNGSFGDDVLIGGPGRDTLTGGRGLDTLTGGAGADRFVFNVGDASLSTIDSISDFTTGEDTLSFAGTRLTISRVSPNASLLFGVSPGSPDTVIGVNGVIQGPDVTNAGSAPLNLDIVGLDGVSETLIGSGAADNLFGKSGDDVLIGGAGADALYGDAGADVLTGGDGADRFAYRGVSDSNALDGYDIITDFVSGTDKIDLFFLNGVRNVSVSRLNGGSFLFIATDTGQVQVGLTSTVQGADLVNPFTFAGLGYDLIGEAAGETLIGSTGNDRLFGLGGADLLSGGAGDDTLFGDAGADILTGGAGADRFAYRSVTDSGAGGFDVITDFQDFADKIDLTFLSGVTNVTIVRQTGGTSVLFATTATGQLQVGANTFLLPSYIIAPAGSPANFGYDLVGTAGGDAILIGGVGDDKLFGLAGADGLNGGAGNDLLYGDGGGDTLNGGAGADIFAYRAITDSPGSALDKITDFQVGIDKVDLRALHASSADKYGYVVNGADTLLFFDQGGDGTNEIVIGFIGVTNLQPSDILF